MQPLQELLFKMADDALIFGHRNSEWTGLGPTLEEDISFSSMAQDKVGHAYNLYNLLHESFGEQEPDALAFMRNAKDFKCCHFVELPPSGTGEGDADYAFSLMRQFLYDHAEILRYEMLTRSSYQPLADFAKKVKGELKYHLMHGNTWVRKLAKGTEESKARLQSALNEAYPFSLSIFEPGEYEQELQKEQIFEGEAALKEKWQAAIRPVLDEAGLHIPDVADEKMHYGGRKGDHTEYLQPLLEEMAEVFRLDHEAEW